MQALGEMVIRPRHRIGSVSDNTTSQVDAGGTGENLNVSSEAEFGLNFLECGCEKSVFALLTPLFAPTSIIESKRGWSRWLR